MSKRASNIIPILLLILFSGVFLLNVRGFSENPSYTDNFGDSSPGCTDILYIWVDNNATYIKFRTEVNGSIVTGMSIFNIYISTNDNTGTNISGDTSNNLLFLANYRINYDGGAAGSMGFFDYGNGSNNLINPHLVGMGYSLFLNNNKTIEIGYRLQTYHSGEGYLNLSIGQSIQLGFKSYVSTDYAPDVGKNAFYYILQEETPGGIPGFEGIFLIGAIFIVGVIFRKIK